MMIVGPGYSGDMMLHCIALLPLANVVSRSEFYRSIKARHPIFVGYHHAHVFLLPLSHGAGPS